MRRLDSGLIYEIEGRLKPTLAREDSPAGTRWRFAEVLWPLGLYLVLAGVFFARWGGGWTQSYLGHGASPIAFIWFLNWWPYAIMHGFNPFFYNGAWFPQTLNLAVDASVPSAALLALPVTLLGGPVLAFNMLSVLAPVLAAWSAFLLCREISGDAPAAAVGGYLFGFSSYECAELLGHLNLDLVFLVPLAVWLCVRRFRGGMTGLRFVLSLALLLLAQLGFSSEILAGFCLLGLLALGLFWLCVTPQRPEIMRLGLESLGAVVLAALVASPFIYCMLSGLWQVAPNFHPPALFATDLLNYVSPTMATQLGRRLVAGISMHYTGNLFEQGAYLGLPLIVILGLYFWKFMRRGGKFGLLAVTLMLVVFSLGPVLHVAGASSHIYLPWWLVAHLPFAHFLLPARFTLYVSLCAAVAVTLWLGESAGRRRVERFVAAGVACLFLVPNMSAYAWSPWPRADFFNADHVAKALGPNANVIILPFGRSGSGIAWQMQSGMAFTQTGGDLGYTPRAQAEAPLMAQMLAGRPAPGFDNNFTLYVMRHGVDHVLLAPGTPAPLVNAIAALGWPHVMDDGIAVVKVPGATALRYVSVAGNYWPLPGNFSWMGQEMSIVTNNQAVTVTLDGQYRPAGPPVQINVSSGADNHLFTVGAGAAQTIKLPATATTTLTASSTFAAAPKGHPELARRLSVLVAIAPSR